MGAVRFWGLTGYSFAAALAAVSVSLPLAFACGESAFEEPDDTPPAVLVGTPGPWPPEPFPQRDPQVLVLEYPEETIAPDFWSPGPRVPGHVSLDWLAAFIEPPAVPDVAAPQHSPGLKDAILGAVPAAPGRYSVVVHNLADGRYGAVDPHHVYYGASLFKLGVLWEAYQQRDAGELDFGATIQMTEEYAEYDLATLGLLDIIPGDTLTVGDALKAMIVVSDTATAILLTDTIGGNRIDQNLRDLGITSTSFYSRDLPVTAADMAAVITAIASGEGVSDDSRRQMLSLLLQEGYRDGIPGGVPAGTAAAHKTGSFGQATHDVAIVWGPAGPYAIAVLSDQPDNWGSIARISSAVWDYFAANP